MGIFDEFKRLAHPYEDEEDDGYDDFDVSPRPVERRERAAERPPRDSSYSGGYSSYSSSPPDDDRRSNKVVNSRAATQLVPKNMMANPASPRAKKIQMAVLKSLRFSFSRPRAWASDTSLESARGRPAVEMERRTL